MSVGEPGYLRERSRPQPELERWVGAAIIVGGAGFIGRAVAAALLSRGHQVLLVDRRPPAADLLDKGAQSIVTDVLTEPIPDLPEGRVLLMLGDSHPRPRRPWTMPIDNALATARLLPTLRDREVVLLSSLEVYGCAPPPLCEMSAPGLPLELDDIDDWCAIARRLAEEPCPPWRGAPLARRLVESDTTGRWAYGLSKLAQERLLLQGVDPASVVILRLANVFGHGQERIVSRWTRRALAGQPLSVTETMRSFVPLGELCRLLTADLPAGIYNVGAESVSLLSVAARIKELCDSNVEVRIEPPRGQDSCGMIELSHLAAAGYVIDPPWEHIERLVQHIRTDDGPVFDPPLPVVVAPRPNRPDEVVERQQAALWGGALKHGNRWSAELSDRLAESLELDHDHVLMLCASGTAALRLGIVAVAGPAQPRDVAVLPAFTFPATAEVLRQLRYQLRFVDVEPSTWTVDPAAVERALAPGDVRVVVAVDTFGNPCDYRRLRAVCESAGVPLIGDSAAALGSRYRGLPLAQQADAHAYSMSFAKVLSAGGAGGAVVLRREARARVLEDPAGWSRSELMDELHAIVALDQLAALEHLVERRNRIARIYRDALPILRTLVPQQERTGCRHSYVHWVARVTGAPDRDQLQRALLGRGVETKPYFRAVGFGLNGTRSDLPVTARLDAEVLALPMSSEMTEEQAEQVVFATYSCLSASR